MNYIRHLNAFFSFVRSDNRLTSSHVSLYLALFQYWNFNRFNNPFPVYRENIMQISKIGSKNTYHKCMKHLHNIEYIIYHPPTSKFKPVKISMKKLDGKEQNVTFRQLDLFNQSSTNNNTDSVSKLNNTSTNNETNAVSNVGQYIKHKQENCVNPPTKNFQKKRNTEQPVNNLAGVSNMVHMPLLVEVERFFKENNHTAKEAQKFFYYNQGKSWMLTDKIPIYDWKAVANKWILNLSEQGDKEPVIDIGKDLQYLYDRFLEGDNISKHILPEYCDHLQLHISDAIQAEAIQRRINQLIGSNQHSESQLWQAYNGEITNDTIIQKDQANLLSLTKRLAVFKHFEQLKQQGKTCIQ